MGRVAAALTFLVYLAWRDPVLTMVTVSAVTIWVWR